MNKNLETDQLGQRVYGEADSDGKVRRKVSADTQKRKVSFHTRPYMIRAFPAAYAFLWFDGYLTKAEKERLNSLYLDIEGKGSIKFFKRGRLNDGITPSEREAAKNEIAKYLDNALIRMGREENLPLIKFGFEHLHGHKGISFIEALKAYGFKFDEKYFTCNENGNDVYLADKNGYGFFLLPSYQLEMIIPEGDEILAYLSDCALYDNDENFISRAMKMPKGADFDVTVQSDLRVMREDWNNWIKQAY